MNLEKLLAKEIPAIEHTISEKDCMLYALGIGLGSNPLDPKELQFVYENDLKVFPSYSVVIAHPGFWVADPELEIDVLKLLHAEQSITQHRPVQPNRTYIGNYCVLGVVDKGRDKGAILYQEKTLTDKESGDCVSTVNSSYFLRGDGGCGSTDFEPPSTHAPPERPADKIAELVTATNAALVYRLSGDYNPLHADPDKAGRAGFERPILHGLCSFGMAVRAILENFGNAEPEKLLFAGLRFSAPVYPGETIRVSMWQETDGISFSATSVERGVKVLDRGLARLSG